MAASQAGNRQAGYSRLAFTGRAHAASVLTVENVILSVFQTFKNSSGPDAFGRQFRAVSAPKLRRFNWRWRLNRLRRSEELVRFLLKFCNRAAMICVRKHGAHGWHGRQWQRSERWVCTAMIQLLWIYA